MTFRHEMTDLELCINLVPEAGEYYRRALDVMTAYPDYAKTQFRIVLELYTAMLAQRFRVDIDQIDLYEAINELSASQIIDHSLRSNLHAIRKAGNTEVHARRQKESSKAGAEELGSKKVGGAGDREVRGRGADVPPPISERCKDTLSTDHRSLTGTKP